MSEKKEKVQEKKVEVQEKKVEVQEKKVEVQEKKVEVQEKKVEVQEKPVQFTNQFGMDELINYKISLLNQHRSNCYCEDCKILMNEIRDLLNEKNNIITTL
jgi:16S rRNA U516 pseudouridylate synthase RsuA-like enzyme